MQQLCKGARDIKFWQRIFKAHYHALYTLSYNSHLHDNDLLWFLCASFHEDTNLPIFRQRHFVDFDFSWLQLQFFNILFT